MVFGLSVLKRVYNFTQSVLNRVWSVRFLLLNMACTVFSNPRSGTFVNICPKQGPKVESVVLHKVGILVSFSNVQHILPENEYQNEIIDFIFKKYKTFQSCTT